MAQKWYEKATVQSAMVGGVAVIIAALISVISAQRRDMPSPSPAVSRQPVTDDSKRKSNLSEFSVIDKTTIIDLRTAKNIPESKLSERYSFVNLYHHIRLRNTGTLSRLRLPYKTGGAGLDVTCLTHSSRVYTSSESQKNSAGKFSILRLLEIDIESTSEPTEILVVNNATYWNAFERFPRYGMITNNQLDPQQMSILVIFPQEIPFPDYRIFRIVDGKRTNSLGHTTFENRATNSLHVKVAVTESNVTQTYLVEWDYLPYEPEIKPAALTLLK